jgi:hypothetical protein
MAVQQVVISDDIDARDPQRERGVEAFQERHGFQHLLAGTKHLDGPVP